MNAVAPCCPRGYATHFTLFCAGDMPNSGSDSSGSCWICDSDIRAAFIYSMREGRD